MIISIIHKPFKNQVKFLIYPSEELLYGGQAGGGKSDALLMSALQYVTEPEYNALIIRRTLEDLDMPNAIMDRAKQWLLPFEDKGMVTWKEQKKRFIFPSGATLTFRYLNHNKHLNSYQGAELQFVGFDELTQFPENQYNYLGGIGHEWVKERFINNNSKLPFIPSAYTDNLYLNQQEYSRQLDKLDALTKQQLKYGDWEAVINEGLLIDRAGLNKCLIPYEEFKNWEPSYCTIGIDPASSGTDKFAMACLVYFNNGKLVLVDLDVDITASPEETLKNFIIRNSIWKPAVINFEREPGSDSQYALNYWNNTLLDLSVRYGFYVIDTPASSTGSKYNRARPHANLARSGVLLFNKDIGSSWVNGEVYKPLNNLFNQYIYVHPDKEQMSQYNSPDELDSVSYAFSELQKVITGLPLG